MTDKEYLIKYLLRLGDDSLIAGQRMAEWCSRGPVLEEDLAMVNISLDYFGQAEALLEYAAELMDDGTSADDLAFGRSEREYYNHLLVELPNGDFAQTMLKLLFFSSFQVHNFNLLCSSSNEKLAAIASRSFKEAKYHFRHASDWIMRLAKGTEESRSRVLNAMDEIYSYTMNLFEHDEIHNLLVKAELAPGPDKLQTAWNESIQRSLAKSDLIAPDAVHFYSGGIDGVHTEHLGHLLTEMQYLHHAHPGARW